ncbi:MAG: Ig-like domain-containing protein [Clostridiales bacterium]|nr:Ig-like domain-containing protein [Clostridiales bacterium]
MPKALIKIISIFIITVIAFGAFPAVFAFGDVADSVESAQATVTEITTRSGNKTLPVASPSAIVREWKEIPETYTGTVYDSVPKTTSPYSAGKLNKNYLNDGLMLFNFYRYVSRMPKVTLSETECEKQQYGCVVLAALNQLTHTPSKPNGMSDSFYNRGYVAANTSNTGAGTYTDTQSLRKVIQSCFEENNLDNLHNLRYVSHRRWILAPNLTSVGFGQARSEVTISPVSTETLVFNSISTTAATPMQVCSDYDYISFPPSGYCPSELVNVFYPWNVSFNTNKYKFTDVKNIKVKITRQSDNKVFTLPAVKDEAVSVQSSYVRADTALYGIPSCIVFHISPLELGADSYHGTYKFEISGLKTAAGADAVLKYSTTFFSFEDKIPYGMTIVEYPRTQYKVGEQFDAEGLMLEVTYSDGTTETVDNISKMDISGYDPNKSGRQEITVKYNDLTASFYVTATNEPVTGISLTPRSVDLKKGQTLQLSPVIEPEDASNKNITWTSSNSSVASVSKTGVVTALSGGNASITATTEDGGYHAVCLVSITVPVSSVTVSPKSGTIYVGKTIQLSSEISPADASDKGMTWYSMDGNVATVSESGLVTGVSPGTARIICLATSDSAKTDACEITVKEYVMPSGVTVSPSETSLYVGHTVRLSASVLPNNAVNKNVTWSSSNGSVATVASDGLVSAKKAGTAVITAKAVDGSVSGSCRVTVLENKLERITIANLPKTQYTYRDSLDKTGLTLNAEYSDGSVKQVTDMSKMNVTGFDGKKTGVQTLTVSYSGLTTTYTVEVTMALWQWIIMIFLFGFLWY